MKTMHNKHHFLIMSDNPHTGYSTFLKGGVSCSKDSVVINQTLVFQIKFCGKSPALRVAAKRCKSPKTSVTTS